VVTLHYFEDSFDIPEDEKNALVRNSFPPHNTVKLWLGSAWILLKTLWL
jgi:hypothetical protein